MEKRTNSLSEPTLGPFISIEAQAIMRQLLGNPDIMVRSNLLTLAHQLLATGTLTLRNDTYQLTATMDTLATSPWRERLIREERSRVERFGRPLGHPEHLLFMPRQALDPESYRFRPMLPLEGSEDEKEVVASSSGTESDPPRLETSEELAPASEEDEPSFELAPEEEPKPSRLMVIHRANMENALGTNEFFAPQ